MKRNVMLQGFAVSMKTAKAACGSNSPRGQQFTAFIRTAADSFLRDFQRETGTSVDREKFLRDCGVL